MIIIERLLNFVENKNDSLILEEMKVIWLAISRSSISENKQHSVYRAFTKVEQKNWKI